MNENEIRRMQQEAVRRAQEMQNRAKTNENQQNKQPEKSSVQPSDCIDIPENKQSRNNERSYSSKNNNLTENAAEGIFDIFMKDKEKTLILCLLIILMDEKTDSSLLLALLYLLI